MSDYVLCRRDIAEIGRVEYCAKPIPKGEKLYCAYHASRLPFWP